MDDARAWLQAASRVAALTGAGISAESGIPTFRGADGLWKHYRAEDLATPEAFARNPRLVWQWYDWRRCLISRAQPNPGHAALAELEMRNSAFTLITQNVDGLHERAGSRDILEVHGNIWRVRCIDCGGEHLDMHAPLDEIPPRCSCGGLLRPGVVWFGEPLPAGVWARAEAAARHADVFLVIGTSAAVYPAAGLVLMAKSSGAKVVEINVDDTGLSAAADCRLRGKSGELLPRLIA